MPPDLLIVRTFIVQFFILRDGDDLYLIDTGFIGGIRALEKALTARGWHTLPIRGILLTHGHLDHVRNAPALAKKHGAWIAGPEGDLKHYESRAHYSGLGRMAGIAEWIGRRIWGGLRVIALPGHTHGHCGYYSAKHRLLFSGDLFATFGLGPQIAPAYLNQDNTAARRSIHRALELPLDGVLPCHADKSPPAKQLDYLRSLASA